MPAYRPDGDWARLFVTAPGFVRTELWRDGDGIYLTADYWEASRFRRFPGRSHGEEYRRLDAGLRGCLGPKLFSARSISSISPGRALPAGRMSDRAGPRRPRGQRPDGEQARPIGREPRTRRPNLLNPIGIEERGGRGAIGKGELPRRPPRARRPDWTPASHRRCEPPHRLLHPIGVALSSGRIALNTGLILFMTYKSKKRSRKRTRRPNSPSGIQQLGPGWCACRCSMIRVVSMTACRRRAAGGKPERPVPFQLCHILGMLLVEHPIIELGSVRPQCDKHLLAVGG